MTRDALLKQLALMSDNEFAKVQPYLEADLEAIDSLPDLQAEIARGRESAATEPLESAEKVYERVRRKLSS